MSKILIIEDEKPLLNAIKIRCEQAGFKVILAEDGFEALKKIKEKPDLIWLDIYLPKMSGFEFLKKLKSKSKKGYPDIPVIIVSNSGSEEKKEKAKKLGVVAYFVKANFKLDEIIKQCQKIIFNKKTTF